MGALKYHMLRSEYVIKSIFAHCHQSELNVAKYGWSTEGGKVQILWDEEEEIRKVTAGKGCGCRAKNVMAQPQAVGAVTGCANLVVKM